MKQSFTLENELQEKVEKITEVDYGKDIDLETIEEMIKDLIYEYHVLEEKLEDTETEMRYMERNCEENHINKEHDIDPYDYYGVSRNDFI